MILCVAPSPAWDVTYHVDRLAVHATNRARAVHGRAGGKAVNVARLLHALGEEVRVVAPVGGPTGELFTADLARAGVELVALPQGSDLRRTVTVVSDEIGDATGVNEPARVDDWNAFLAMVDRNLSEADVVVASGSPPDGAPDSAFALLTVAARDRRVPVLVDTSGPALALAADAGPTLVKPNADELRWLVPGADDPLAAARRASELCGTAVAVSLGGDGMVLAAGGSAWTASSAEPLRGNPTGAGDAAVAAFARAVLRRAPWAEALADAVALSAAAVLAPYAGEHVAGHRASVSVRVCEDVR
jgi:tagatose 6-phosphate kinase